MSVESCPQCSGRVTLPAGASDDAWVRCPICAAEYPLRRVTEEQPPALVVIERPLEPFPGRAPARGAVVATGSATIRQTPQSPYELRPEEVAPKLVTSAEAGEDSDVFTFDDSLLLDEPTGELPRATDETAPRGDVSPVAIAMSQADVPGHNRRTDRVPAENETDMGHHDIPEPTEPTESGRIAGAPPIPAAGERFFAGKLNASPGASVENLPQFGLVPRRRARRRNPLFMFGGIVGGGILGLAIGYAILMWAFDPPRDPLRLAPSLPGFMVPEALRAGVDPRVAGFATDDESGGGEPEKGAADKSTPWDDTGADNLESENNGAEAGNVPSVPAPKEHMPAGLEPLPDSGVDSSDLSKSTTTTDSGAAPKQPDALINPYQDSAPKETSSVAADAANDPVEPATAQQPDDGNAQPTAAVRNALRPDSIEVLGPISEKHYTREDLLSAIAAAKATTARALELPVNAPPAEKKKVNGPFYLNLSRVAEALTLMTPPDGVVGNRELHDKATTAAIEAILDAVPDQARLEEVGKLAGYWFERPQGNGIVLCGMVKDSKTIGTLVESMVEPLGHAASTAAKEKPRVITVVSPSALTADPGRPVLIAGTIVKDPATNLRGYQGSATTVVWAAMAFDPKEPASATR